MSKKKRRAIGVIFKFSSYYQISEQSTYCEKINILYVLINEKKIMKDSTYILAQKRKNYATIEIFFSFKSIVTFAHKSKYKESLFNNNNNNVFLS